MKYVERTLTRDHTERMLMAFGGKIKTEKTQIEERLKQIENERNFLKNDNIKYQKSEESRQKETTKSIAATITLQESLEKEKERLNDERVQEKESYLNEMKLTWSKHEKDVQNHFQNKLSK